VQADLEQMVRKHGDMVLRLAVSHVGNRADAEDVFQEVFIRLVRSIDKIQDEDHLRNWLVRVTINRSRSVFASASRKRELPVEELPETIGESFSDAPLTPATDAMQSLPEKYRAPLHMFYFEELPISDIAKIMECSEGTIKSQLSRGRQMLRESLGEMSYV